ncbi:hypothetical protein ACCC88_09810 [Sphingomonas sp. Sphisp140]|uniref:hypothetical protein n=1 Tax=unclassified Sphingomonas TaxID=196159 RepID=UPI0039AED507
MKVPCWFYSGNKENKLVVIFPAIPEFGRVAEMSAILRSVRRIQIVLGADAICPEAAGDQGRAGII